MTAAGGWSGPAGIAAIGAAGLASALPAATTTGLLEHAARRVPDRPALLFLPNGRADDAPVVLTHAALLDRVLRFAGALRGLGVARGDGAALLLPPRPETFVALFGAEAATHVVPLNPMLSAEHLATLLREARVRVLVALGPDADYPGIWPKARDLARMLPGLRLIRVGTPPEGGEHGFDALLDAAPVFHERPAPSDLAACFHTGGTTGAPKLVRHSHANQAHAAWFLGLGYGLGPQDAVLNGFPLFHVAGAICHGLAELAHGAAIVVPSQTGMRNRAFVADHWRVVERFRVSILTGGPTFLTTLLNLPPGGADISSARVLITGGSPLPPPLADAFEARFGVPVRALLGMTEACGIVSLEPLANARVPQGCGWPLPFSELRVLPLGPDGAPIADAAPLPPNTTGVLVIRGPQVSDGYTDAGLTDASRLPGGWLVTGDLGHLDEQGRVFVTGRAKDVIIRGGHNLDPAAIEEAFLAHPEVELCAAVGLPDTYAGEVPMVFVTRRPGATIGAEALLAAVAPRIPEPAAVPKRIEFLPEMALTATGKVFKPELRRRAAELALRDALPPGAEVSAVLTPQGVMIECRLPASARQDVALRERLSRYRLPVRVA
jgi:fatty-acyl-CoA synthase